MLDRLKSLLRPRTAPPGQSVGAAAEAAEQDAARRRILAQAEAGRVPAEDTTRAVPERRWRRGGH